jgi:hypothetical protein
VLLLAQAERTMGILRDWPPALSTGAITPVKPASLSIRRDKIDATAALGLPEPMSMPKAEPNLSAHPRE